MVASGVAPVWLVSFELRKMSDGTTGLFDFVSGDKTFIDSDGISAAGSEVIAPASVVSVGAVSAELDVNRRSTTLGDVDISMVDDGAIRDLIDTYYFAGKKATLRLGLHGWSVSDFETVGVYTVDEITPAPGGITFQCKEVGAEWRGRSIQCDFASWHPLECIQIILEDCGVHRTAYNAESLWPEQYAGIHHWVVSRAATDFDAWGGTKQDTSLRGAESAQSMIDDLVELCGGMFSPGADGAYRYKHYDPTAAVVDTIGAGDVGEFAQVETWGNVFAAVDFTHAAAATTTKESTKTPTTTPGGVTYNRITDYTSGAGLGTWRAVDKNSRLAFGIQQGIKERTLELESKWCNGMARMWGNPILAITSAVARGLAIVLASSSWFTGGGNMWIVVGVGHGVAAGEWISFSTVTSTQNTPRGEDRYWEVLAITSDAVVIAEPPLGVGGSATEIGEVVRPGADAAGASATWIGKEGDQVFLTGYAQTGGCGTFKDYHSDIQQGGQHYAVAVGRQCSAASPVYLEFWRENSGRQRTPQANREVMSFDRLPYVLRRHTGNEDPRNFNEDRGTGLPYGAPGGAAGVNWDYNPTGYAYVREPRTPGSAATPRPVYDAVTEADGWRDGVAQTSTTGAQAVRGPTGRLETHAMAAMTLRDRGLFGTVEQDWGTTPADRAGTRVIDRTIAIAVAQRKLDRFSSGCPMVSVTTDLSRFALEIGDFVALDHDLYINHGHGRHGTGAVVWEVIQKEVRITDDSPMIFWKLAFVRWDSAPALPTSTQDLEYTSKPPQVEFTQTEPSPVLTLSLEALFSEDGTTVLSYPTGIEEAVWPGLEDLSYRKI